MNILVTGSRGMLGTALVNNLKNIKDNKNRTRPNIHIDEIYAKYAEELKCNHRGTEYYHEIVKYYENQDWLKV